MIGWHSYNTIDMQIRLCYYYLIKINQSIGKDKRMKGKLSEPRPCPYCKYQLNYHQAHSILDDTNRCTKCNEIIIYELEIYPTNQWLWGKRSNWNRS